MNMFSSLYEIPRKLNQEHHRGGSQIFVIDVKCKKVSMDFENDMLTS